MFRSLLKLNFVTIYRPLLYSNINYSTNSKLISQEESSCNNIHKYSILLSDYGFKPGQINRILKSPHSVSILSIRENELLSNLVYWLKFGVKEKLLTSLCAYPELLTLNPDFIDFRIKELMTLFAKKDIDKLLVTCPRVFLDEFTSVYERVQYIVHMMGVEQKSIVKRRALQFDLNHIKCRHMFVFYAGKYVLFKKANKSKNAPLNKVFSRNIHTFLKLTNLTEEEFFVFCRCFEEGLLEFPEDDDSDNEE